MAALEAMPHIRELKENSDKNQEQQHNAVVEQNDVLPKGFRVGRGRYEVVKRFDYGSFGDIYAMWDRELMSCFVMKLSKGYCNMTFEAEVVRKMYDSGSKHAMEFRGSGFLWKAPICQCGYFRQCDIKCPFCNELVLGDLAINRRWIMIEQLGENLWTWSLRVPVKTKVDEVVRIGIQCIQALEDLHRLGFVHRDVKPNNFARGGTKETENIVYLLDYGVVRYWSTSEHQGRESGRQDDLIKVMYMLSRFVNGRLPWEQMGNIPSLLEQSKLTTPTEELFQGCPAQFCQLWEYLNTLSYEDEPNYRKMKEWMEEIMEEKGYPKEGPFDGIRRKTAEAAPTTPKDDHIIDYKSLKKVIKMPPISLYDSVIPSAKSFSLSTEIVEEIQTEQQIQQAENCTQKTMETGYQKMLELSRKINAEGITVDSQKVTWNDLHFQLDFLYRKLLQLEDEENERECESLSTESSHSDETQSEGCSGCEYPDVSESDVENQAEISWRIHQLKKKEKEQKERMEILKKQLEEKERETGFYKAQSSWQLKILHCSLQSIKQSLAHPLEVFWEPIRDTPDRDLWLHVWSSTNPPEKLNVPEALRESTEKVLLTMEVDVERILHNLSSIQNLVSVSSWPQLHAYQAIRLEVMNVLEKNTTTQDQRKEQMPPSSQFSHWTPFRVDFATTDVCKLRSDLNLCRKPAVTNTLLKIETDLERILPNFSQIKKFSEELWPGLWQLFQKFENMFTCCLNEVEDMIWTLRNEKECQERHKALAQLKKAKKALFYHSLKAENDLVEEEEDDDDDDDDGDGIIHIGRVDDFPCDFSNVLPYIGINHGPDHS